MTNRRTAPASYRDAQLQARSTEDDLLRSVGAEIDRALRLAVEQFEALLRQLPDGTESERQAALTHSLHILQNQRILLQQRLAQATIDGRTTSFEDILQAWQDATKEAAQALGVPHAALGDVLVPRTTMLAAYQDVGGAGLFRTLLVTAAADGYQAVNDVIRHAITTGQSFDALARDLRAYVRGGDEGSNLADAFRTVRFNATRIAYSEIHNARAEAEVQHFALDPLVSAVAWRLSPDRGTLRGPDVCDVLAANDFYGLGPGVYPVAAVPLPPHPFDRCERVPIVRPISRMDDPKPAPPLSWPGRLVVPRVTQLSRARHAAVTRDTEQLLQVSADHPANALAGTLANLV